MFHRSRVPQLALVFATLLGLATATGRAHAHNAPSGQSLTAPMIDATGAQIGMASASSDPSGHLLISVIASGLPAGEHGIHIHTTGQCDPAGEKPFASAGAHYNPTGEMHGNHAGDLGNLWTDEEGETTFLAVNEDVMFPGDANFNDADGVALVIHETTDDLVTDPSGNSGARIACAVLIPDSTAAASAGPTCEGTARTFEEIVTLFAGFTPVDPVVPTEISIPVGQPADQATVDSVSATIDAIVNCINSGNIGGFLGYLEDDAIRTSFSWIGASLIENPGEVQSMFENTPPAPAGQAQTVLAVAEVSLLENGRVGVLMVIDDPQSEDTSADALYLVLTPNGSTWRIAEVHALDGE